MTRDEILQMEPGREMDCLIIQKVFGKLLWNDRPNWYLDVGTPTSSEREFCKVPRFSTNIEAAWDVEEHMMTLRLTDDYGFELYAITGADETKNGIHNINMFKVAHATPEQRCKAALLAVMEA